LLKRLSLYGFKTFAKKTEIEFNNGITCIVGPNGSGKSNISDALRWILGEQGMKPLRSDKLTEVIFAGSEFRKPLNISEVVMLLENKSERFPLKYSEIEITRRIYRDNKSEFLINRNPCRLKDIQDIFLDTGLGKGGISMIGQGQIEKIISSDPSDRRALFEETAGINKYQHRKQESLKKLDLTGNNLLRLSDIIQEVEGRIAPLKQEVNKLSRFNRYKERVENLQRELLLQEYFSLYRKDEEALNHLQHATEEVNNIKENLKKLEINHRELSEELKHLSRDKQKYENHMNGLTVELEQVKGRTHSYITRRKELKERLASTLQLMESLEEQKKKLLEDREKEIMRLDELKKKIDHLSLEINSKEKEHKKDLEYLSELREKYNKSKEEVLTCAQKITGKSKEMDSLSSGHEELKREMFSLQEGRRETVKKIKELVLLRDDTLKEVEKFSLSKDDVKREIASLKEKKQNLNTSLEKLRIDLVTLFKTFSEKEVRLNFLKELEKSFEGYFPGVKAIMTARKKNIELSGIAGVVGSLIQVPQKYEKAIEVSLGGHIQDIVTETDRDARLSVEFLRSTGKGRATFLPLNIIKTSYYDFSREGGWDKKPSVIGQASRLIEYEEKYEKIINYLLSHFYIVKDLSSGIELLKTYNLSATLVTLDGDIIRPAGAITGGSTENKKMSLLSRTREIEELSRQLSEIKSRKDTLQNKEITLQKETADIERNLKGQAEKLSILETGLSELLRKKDRIMLEERQLHEKLKENEHNVEINSQKQNKVNLSMGNIQIEIVTLRDREKILEIERKELERNLSLQESTEGNLLEKLNLIKMEHAKSIEASSNLESFIKSRSEQKEQLENNYASCSEERKHLQENLMKMDKEEGEDNIKLCSLNKSYEEAAEFLKCRKKEEKSKEKEINSTTQDIQNFREDLIKKEEIKQEMHIIKARINAEKEMVEAKLPEEYSKPEFIDPEKISQEMETLRNRMENMGFINYNAEIEYEELDKRYCFLVEQKADMEEAIFSLNKVIEDLEKTSRKKFKETFALVSEEFSRIYSSLFPGGQAHLTLTDEENILKSGIEIGVHPPGKRLQSISLLSGGEKTMAAVILLLSIFKVKPTPFCVFDEVDAALDDTNTALLADCIKDFSNMSQFIIISHNKITMEKADILYGVTMEEPGVSDIISIKLGDPVLDELIEQKEKVCI
jgi:chromosome segregation protein